MLKRYTFWLWAAVVFQLLTATFHSLSLFIARAPQNETERRLYDLMTNYKLDAGGGLHPSTGNLVTALSSCFTLLCLLGGLTNAYLLRTQVVAGIVKGLVRMQVLVFGICFIGMASLTFLPPIALSGLIILTLTTAYFVIPDQSQ